MNKALAHLPTEKQDELQLITEIILARKICKAKIESFV